MTILIIALFEVEVVPFFIILLVISSFFFGSTTEMHWKPQPRLGDSSNSFHGRLYCYTETKLFLA